MGGAGDVAPEDNPYVDPIQGQPAKTRPKPTLKQNRLLMEAAVEGDSAGIIQALENGANPNITCDDIKTPKGTLISDVLNVFRGEYVGKRTYFHGYFNEITPLMAACLSGNNPDCVEGVKALIRAGADINAKIDDQFTAIMMAANASLKTPAANAEPLIDALVTAGANVNQKTNGGHSIVFLSVSEQSGYFSKCCKNFDKTPCKPQ